MHIISQDRSLQPYFFGNSASQLLGIYHPPNTGDLNDKGVLLCYPIGHEYMRIHFTFRRLAQMLSDAGCHVLRFDYFGIGDSAGESRDGDVNLWKADINSAYLELQEISGVKRISLVGVRFGATLAALASSNGLHVNELVLWDPVVIGQKYIEELRAINNNLGGFFNKIGENDMFEELLGYPFPVSLHKGIKQINLLSLKQYSTRRIILITAENRKEYWELRNQFEANGNYFEHHVVSDTHEWGKPENFTKTILVNETLHKIKEVIAEDLK